MKQQTVDLKRICKKSLPQISQYMSLKSADFEIEKRNDPVWGIEQDWSLKNEKAKELDLDYLVISIEQGKFRAIWFGPRTNLSDDLLFLGLKKTELLSSSLKKLVKIKGGHYSVLDINGESISLQYEGSDSSGTVAQCFDHRPGH